MKNFLNPNDKAEILERLRNVQPDSQRRWGKMTPHQMLCHLCDSFRVAMGEKSVKPAENLFTRTLMKWVALHTPLPWPHGIPTRPEINQQGGGGTPPAGFERDRQELEKLIERYARERRDFEFGAHPYFGRLSDYEWMRFGYLHCDHHLRQFGV